MIVLGLISVSNCTETYNYNGYFLLPLIYFLIHRLLSLIKVSNYNGFNRCQTWLFTDNDMIISSQKSSNFFQYFPLMKDLMISFLDSSFTSFWLWKCFMKIKHNFVDIFWHVADFCVDPTFPWMCGFLAGYDMWRVIPNMCQYLRFVTKLKRYMVGLKKEIKSA